MDNQWIIILGIHINSYQWIDEYRPIQVYKLSFHRGSYQHILFPSETLCRSEHWLDIDTIL